MSDETRGEGPETSLGDPAVPSGSDPAADGWVWTWDGRSGAWERDDGQQTTRSVWDSSSGRFTPIPPLAGSEDVRLSSHDRRRISGAILGYVLLWALIWGGVWFLVEHGDVGQPWVAIAGWTLLVACVAVVFLSLVAAIRIGVYLTRVRDVPVELAVVVGVVYWLVAPFIGVLLWPLGLWLSERHDLFRGEEDIPSIGDFGEFAVGAETVRAVVGWVLLRGRW